MRNNNNLGVRFSQLSLSSTPFRLVIPARGDRIIFWTVSLILLVVVGITNRSGMLDNENYLNYFKETDLEWFLNIFTLRKNNISLVFSFFTEEFLWRAWALTLGSIFAEDTAVLVTVLLLNLLVILALSKLSRPLFGILLWILLPPALATIGTFQIRQGFAFSIVLYMALSLKRPTLGYFIAASIHTTFLITLVYALTLKLLKKPNTRLLLIYFFISLIFTLAGNQLFYDYGGRRAEQYSIQEGSDSINYIFGALIVSIPSFLNLIQHEKNLTLIKELSSIHIGCIFFIIMSWFLFPIGTSRNGYFALLFLIPILPEFRKKGYFTWYFLLLILVYLAYIIMKTYTDGGYNEILKALY
ncbi:MAG: EpsG family protein [Candidatus Competibacter sp.]